MIMNKKGLYIVMLIAMLLVGCRDQYFYEDSEVAMWDMAPVELNIYVADSTGVDLLNPDAPESIALDSIVVEYNEQKYYLGTELSPSLYRSSEAIFMGLNLKFSNSRYYMSLGEFASDCSFDGEFTITFGNRSPQHYCFYYYLKDENGEHKYLLRYYDANKNQFVGEGELQLIL